MRSLIKRGAERNGTEWNGMEKVNKTRNGTAESAQSITHARMAHGTTPTQTVRAHGEVCSLIQQEWMGSRLLHSSYIVDKQCS